MSVFRVGLSQPLSHYAKNDSTVNRFSTALGQLASTQWLFG